MPPAISIICVTYNQMGALKILVQSILNQTAPNWTLTVVHDGPSPEFDRFMQAYAAESDGRISFFSTSTRYNDYGHTLRDQALIDIAGDYVLITNGDNYYVPILIEALSKAVLTNDPDVVMFDMIHSHDRPGDRPQPAYCLFKTEYSRNNIDIGSAIVRRSLAQQVGFRDKTFCGDATYFEDVLRLRGGCLKIVKLNHVLLVHN